MTITVPIPEQLTAAQADGRGCVVCGSEAAPMRPMGYRASVQLFACISCIGQGEDGR